MTIKTDILICGAGPVGLLYANILIREGHSVYILDIKEGPTKQSRAFFIIPRSLEILQHHGLAYNILKRALVIRGTSVFIDGSKIGDIKVDEIDTIFPQLTYLPQSNTEEALSEDFEKANETIDIEAKYIIGADGCHSIVRKSDPSWTYHGTTIKTKFALADVILKGDDVPLLENRQSLFYNGIDYPSSF
ncbi:unnamed protein product [Cunninghamella blakesleeana]